MKVFFGPFCLKKAGSFLPYLSQHYFRLLYTVIAADVVCLSLISLGLGYVNVCKEHNLLPEGKKLRCFNSAESIGLAADITMCRAS